MNKHAYLIMAHNNFKVLEKIIELLDNKKNDIYIHIDKKVKFNYEEEKKYKSMARNSKIKFLENRIKISWGGYSQIECELLLIKEALKSEENYSYFHLISGVDLPLKNSDQIYNFFEKNNGKEFVHFFRKMHK